MYHKALSANNKGTKIKEEKGQHCFSMPRVGLHKATAT